MKAKNRQLMNWIPINTPNKKEIDSLAKQLSVDLLISKILIQRGVNTFDKAKKFFRPKLDDLYDPFLMKDMNIAVDRIQKAISKKEKILVYILKGSTLYSPTNKASNKKAL